LVGGLTGVSRKKVRKSREAPIGMMVSPPVMHYTNTRWQLHASPWRSLVPARDSTWM